MKKITFSLLALFGMTSVFGQYSTGTMNLSSFGSTSLGMTAKIDVSPTLVTLTLTGASTDWLGIGFNASGMGDVGMDCVIFDGTNLTDRRFNGVGVTPPLDTQQNWTVTSNTVSAGTRTVVGTRALSTGDANDYTFTAAANALTIVYARRSGSLTIGYHGGDSCGSTTANLALATEDFKAESVKMYPNPAKGSVNFQTPSYVSSGEIKFYDVQGRMVKQQEINSMETAVSTSGMITGTYMAVVRTEYGNVTKTLVVE